MQAAEACPQEEPMKEVLRTLGLRQWEVHKVNGVRWRLLLQSSELFR